MSKKTENPNDEIINMRESDFASSYLSTALASIFMLIVSIGITYFAMESGLLNPLTEIIHSFMIDLAKGSGDFQVIIIVAGRDGWMIAEMFAAGVTFYISVFAIGAIGAMLEHET